MRTRSRTAAADRFPALSTAATVTVCMLAGGPVTVVLVDVVSAGGPPSTLTR